MIFLNGISCFEQFVNWLMIFLIENLARCKLLSQVDLTINLNNVMMNRKIF